ncbi:oxidoreductase YqhD [Klebsiella aerogenes]|nr:oxidoreductase YqhD [Klebsiella aerogenes]
MNNFDLHTPTRILFGKGAIEKLREQIPAEARVLITYGGGSVKKTGVLDQVLTALNGLDVLEFGGIEPNPSYETLMNAVKLAREEKVTFLLAVGGGSVLDGTKFIAAAAHYDADIDPWEILETYGSKIASAIPMGSVLTLPATGSDPTKARSYRGKPPATNARLCLRTSSRSSRSSIRFIPIPCRRARSRTAWLTPSSIPSSST